MDSNRRPGYWLFSILVFAVVFVAIFKGTLFVQGPETTESVAIQSEAIGPTHEPPTHKGREETTPSSLKELILVEVFESGTNRPAIGARVAVLEGIEKHEIFSIPDPQHLPWIEVDEAGKFQSEVVSKTGNLYTVVAIREGALSEAKTISPDITKGLTKVTLFLPSLGKISGRVSTDGGLDIEGASVSSRLVDFSWSSTRAVTSVDPESGEFLIENCPEGSWAVIFRKGNLPTATYTDILVKGGKTTVLNHHWGAGSELAITLLDSKGEIVDANYEFTLTPLEGNWWRRGLIAKGRASVENLPSGKAWLHVFPTKAKRTGGGLPLFNDEIIDIKDSRQVVRLTGKSRSATIFGKVFLGEQLVSSGRVRATLADGSFVTTKIENGEYRLEGVTTGELWLRWRINNKPTDGFQRLKVIHEGENHHDLHTASGVLRIRVVASEDGEPIVGCPIRIEYANGRLIGNRLGVPFYANPIGEFEMAGMTPEPIEITVGPALMAGSTLLERETKRISLPADAFQGSEFIEINLKKSRKLSVVVRKNTGQKIKDASVFLFDKDGRSLSYAAWQGTDHDGELVLNCCPEGPFMVVVRHEDYAPSVSQVRGTGKAVELDVILEKGIPVTFGGIPPSGNYPRLSIRSGYSGLALREPLASETGGTGKATTMGLFSGEETVRLAPGWYTAWVTTDSAKTDPVDFRVPSGAPDISVGL